MVLGGSSHKKKVGRPKSKSSVGRPAAKKRVSTKKRVSSVGLKDKTVVQLRKLARSAGIPQSHKGKTYKKSSLIRALSGKSKSKKLTHRK